MIIDTLKNAERYYTLHSGFKTAFEYLNSTNLAALENGVIELGDGIRVIVSNDPGRTREAAAKIFECHNQNIDIQVCIHGLETMGWKPRADCQQVEVPYNPEKDYMFYNDEPDTYFSLKNGQYVIFFPEDVHAPMIGEGLIKKLVVKVPVYSIL
ncbi:YhcH/YjgK/YiaL family protein [Mucilaginibacter panaciglaebae]|uniref:YhcH/YjgK/YiaL family protein n=1 Tax=Mucilaginibacter panaciglaebae TaxID=502331 RepID=A0ABP7WD61_9SPHI